MAHLPRLSALLVLFATTAARAQEGAPERPPPEPEGAAAPAAAPPASGSEAAPDERALARELAQQGDAAFGSGRCDKAIALWRRAEAKFHAPTLLLRVARCQALLGKVVAATATLEAIAAERLPSDAPPPFVEAREAAVRELPGVRARIATLRVSVSAKGIGVEPLVLIDGTARRGASTSFAVDPGDHRVRIRARDTVWERSVTLDDGESQAVEVSLAEERPAPAPSTQRYVGYTVGGVGVAAFLVGAVLGLAATDTARGLEAVCGPDRNACPPEEADAVSRVKAQSLAADVGIGAGAALVLTGAVLVLTNPERPPEAPRIRVVASGWGARLEARY